MGPVGIVAWSGVRRRWTSLLLLTVVLGLTGAVVLSSVAGSRRGREALDEFVAYNQLGTLEVFVNPGLPPEEQRATLARVVEAADEASFATLAAVVVALPGPDGAQGDGTDFVVAQALLDGPLLEDTARPIVVDGRLPLREGEVAINETIRDRRDAGVGDTLEVAVFAADQIDQVGNGLIPEPAAVHALTVGAVIRQPVDLARSPQSQPGTIYEADEGRLVIHPSFLEETIDVASYGMGAVGHPDPSDTPDVVAAMRAEGGQDVLVNTEGPEDLARLGPVGDAIDLESNALLAVAGVVLLFGLVVVGAAAVRATADESGARDVLQAVGLTPRQVTTARLLRGAVVAVLATAVALAVAVPASSLFPIGLAADAEIDPGIHVDQPVLLIGGAAFLALVLVRLALGEWADRRLATRVRPRRRARGLGNGPMALGARLTLDGVWGRAGPATRVALGTAVLGVAAVAGAATYAASMDSLLGSPERQGWTWDVVVGNFVDEANADEAETVLAANADVEEYLGFNWTTLSVDGESVALAEVPSSGSTLLPVVLEGRAPTGDDEVAFGRGTLDQLGKSIGDRVEIAADGEPVEAEIVGVVIAPAVLSTSMDLDSGGVTTFDLTGRAFADQPNVTAVSSYLVELRPGIERAAALERLREDFPGTVLGPTKPLDVADLERVRGVPYLLAGLLGALALASVVVALTTAARRRRRDIAVLRAVGLARGQLRRLMAGEASTFVALAAALGVPLGVVVGRLAWRAAANGLGSEVGPVVPASAILVTALVVLVAVNGFAQGLAMVVGRRKPGADLRSE